MFVNEGISQAASTKEVEVKYKPKSKKRGGMLWGVGLIGAIVMGTLVFRGVSSRSASTEQLQVQANEAAELTVNVIQPKKASGVVKLQLPGELRAYTQAPIFAQTSGYLKKWYSDIGARVKSGDVLAEIDTPEVDQQLEQSLANLKTAKAQLDFSQATYNRNDDLFRRHVIAAQDFDNSTADLRVKQATVNADEADVKRLQALEAFKTVRAPFDGIVTARNTDIGALVNSGSGTALFTVAQTSPLRLYISVPESDANLVQAGTKANLSVMNFPNRTFPGKVVRTSGAIDPTTKTMLTELEVPNESNELFPGAYAEVNLDLENPNPALLVPANVLLFRSEGPSVGIVQSDHKIKLQKIKISRDLGAELEIADGLQATDQVVVNPSDSLSDGQTVKVQPTAGSKPKS
jgi:RND family efflux transporter MFP subunit